MNYNTFSVSGCKWPIIGNDNALSTSLGGFDGPAPSKRFSLTNIGVEKHSGTWMSYSHDEFAPLGQDICTILFVSLLCFVQHTHSICVVDFAVEFDFETIHIS